MPDVYLFLSVSVGATKEMAHTMDTVGGSTYHKRETEEQEAKRMAGNLGCRVARVGAS